MRFLNVFTLSNEDCRERVGEDGARFVHDSVLCTFHRVGAGLCRYDSGSPLVANQRLIGIASWFTHPCGSGYPDGFTRVSSFLDWISENAGIELA